MASYPGPRPYKRWILQPYYDPDIGIEWVAESASIPYIMEILGTYAEVASVGRARFAGTMAQKNALYQDFRNYVRQALSNFSAAQSVPNRSAGLLYYYAALNFAKAELLDRHAPRLVNQRIGHGLSFGPTNAKTVTGDQLRVTDGVFPILYERRTGHKLPVGTKLPINRLLLQVPEIATQVSAAGGGRCHVSGVLVMFAMDDTHSWALLAISDDTHVAKGIQSVTSKQFNRHFSRVQPPDSWRDHFGLSRRISYSFAFYESVVKLPKSTSGEFDLAATSRILLNLKALLGMATTEDFDAWLAPSMFKTKMVPMPPSLARYALTYYASSLVRYKPQMFDGRSFPEQAYLFDAIARELALPMLQDVLSAVQQRPLVFHGGGSLRV